MPVVTVVPIAHENSTSNSPAGNHEVLNASARATIADTPIAIGVIRLTRVGENTREKRRPEMSAPLANAVDLLRHSTVRLALANAP